MAVALPQHAALDLLYGIFPKGRAVWFVKNPNLSFPLGLFTPLRGEGGKRPDAERSGANQ